MCELVLKRAVYPVGPAPEVRRQAALLGRWLVMKIVKVLPHKSPRWAGARDKGGGRHTDLTDVGGQRWQKAAGRMAPACTCVENRQSFTPQVSWQDQQARGAWHRVEHTSLTRAASYISPLFGKKYSTVYRNS